MQGQIGTSLVIAKAVTASRMTVLVSLKSLSHVGRVGTLIVPVCQVMGNLKAGREEEPV